MLAAAQPELAPIAPAWIRQLVLAADAFVVERPLPATDGLMGGGWSGRVAGASLIAGYPWFNDWGRDTMISLAGLTLSTGRREIAERILRSFAPFIRHGLIPNRFPDQGEGVLEQACYNTVDGTLWFFQALADHHAATGSRGPDPGAVSPAGSDHRAAHRRHPVSRSGWIRPMGC